MTDRELISALRWNMIETGSLICLGCGHEHGCSTHGCAVLREAAERIERLSEKPESNPPLTLDELREDAHSPLYIVYPKHMEDNNWIIGDGWDADLDELCAANGDAWYMGCYGDSWLAYRRKPEEETK